MVFKIVFAPNSPFDFHGIPEKRWRKKKKRGNYEAFCFSSKRNNINVVFIRHYINFLILTKLPITNQFQMILNKSLDKG